MKFWEIFRFEFSYQIRRPWFWLFTIILVGLNFLMMRDRTVVDALFEEFFVNSPFLIANSTVFGGLIWLMMAGAIAGDAGARDVASRMHPLVYATSLKKYEYLGGRFVAAFVLNALLLLAVQIGILLGVYLPGVAPEIIGPFRLSAYFTAYAYLALPNAFFATALQFCLATISGRAMASYFGSFILFFMGFFVASFILLKRGIGTYVDPIGIRFIVEDIAHLWTTSEKNHRLLTLDGIILENRLIWIGVGLIACVITYLSFRFGHRTDDLPWRKFLLKFSTRGSTPGDPALHQPVVITRHAMPPDTAGFVMNVRQIAAIAWVSFKSVATSWPGLFMLGFIPLLTIPVIVDQMESNGVPFIPTTARVLAELTTPLSSELSRWVIVPALLIYFAGELAWRERDARISDLTDSMPGSEWAPLFGKFLGLALLLFTFTTLQLGAGIAAQSIMGYDQFEFNLYTKVLWALQLSEYLLFAFLVLVIHIVVNQKYTGHTVATLTYVFIALSGLFGIEHDLLIFGASPGWTYSEMRGFGPSLTPWLWFKGYWLAWALVLAVAAKLLWVRGRETTFSTRIKIAGKRINTSTTAVGIAGVVLVVFLGSYIFYNTNVVNEYVSSTEKKELQAEYERRYSEYSDSPQPEATHVNLRIEIYPETSSADITGSYTLLNRTKTKIDSIHIAMPRVQAETSFDKAASLVTDDREHGHRIYALQTPLEPGDSIQLNFEVMVSSRGFHENGIDASVTPQATFFTNRSWFPSIGYQRERELITANDRRDHGLQPRPLIAFLNDEEAYNDRGRGVSFVAVMGTSADQIAVAPGALRRSWTDTSAQPGNRKYFEYSAETLGWEWSFFSARYKLHEEVWKRSDSSNVLIRAYHHPGHTAHLKTMLAAIRASFDYYSQNFGPYKRDYFTVIERPGNGSGMHADAGMVSHGEGFTYWNPDPDGGAHDHPYAIVAHEIAHQWTVPYAAVEGAPVMSESVAWYYAMKAIEHNKGERALKKLFDFMWQPHPHAPIFRGQPLLRGLDPYMSYRKGPFALYTMSEYIGEEKVNRALRTLLLKHRPVDAPLATTLDLHRELISVTPDSLHYLIHDLFEANTYWKLKVRNSTASQLPSGEWQVSLELENHKIVVDTAGVKSEIPMDEWIDVGVFSSSNARETLYLQKHRIKSGKQFVTLTVPSKPERAGVDPFHVLNWEERNESNLMEVRIDD